MKPQKACKIIFFCTVVGINANVLAAPADDEILQQQQESILQQKEQELAAKRAEQDLQRQSKQMTTLQEEKSNLAGFTLPAEKNTATKGRWYCLIVEMI